MLHPETTSFLEHHGLIDLGRVSSAARTLRYLTPDGDVLLEEPIAYRFTSYATLYAALVGHLEPERYHLGRAVARLDEDEEGAGIRFEDCDLERFDLVVGADGIRSTVRSLLFPDVRASYAGYVGWRGTLPIDHLPATGLEMQIIEEEARREEALAQGWTEVADRHQVEIQRLLGELAELVERYPSAA